MTDDSDDETSEPGTAVESNGVAAFSYVFFVFSAFTVLTVVDDEFATFHAQQSIALTLVLLATFVASNIVRLILGAIAAPLALVGVLLSVVVVVGGGTAWLFLIYNAYRGEWVRLPGVGSIVGAN